MSELDNLLSYSFEEIQSTNKIVVLLRLASDYLGLPITDCAKEHLKYYQQLQKAKFNKMEAPKKVNLLDKKYILRPNTLLYYNATHFNNDTLTDKIAESAIGKFPRLEGLFLNEKERAVLEAKDSASNAVAAAEAAAEAAVAEPVAEAPEVVAAAPEADVKPVSKKKVDPKK